MKKLFTIIALLVATALQAQSVDTTLTAQISDPDGTIQSIQWVINSGPAGAVLSTPNAAVTRIKGLVVGTYMVKVTAIDNENAITTALVEIDVLSANKAPVIIINQPKIVIKIPGIVR